MVMQPLGRHGSPSIGRDVPAGALGRPPRYDRPRSSAQGNGSDSFDEEKLARNLGWLGIGLGIASVAAGVGSRNSKNGGVVLTALAGVVALGVLSGKQLNGGLRPKARRNGHEDGALFSESEVERSITIGKTADELYQRWRDPKTLPQVMAFLATVRASDNGRMHWQIEGPLSKSLEWDTETVGEHPGEGVGWRSLPGAGLRNEGAIRFRPATGGRGTVATLRLRFDSPDSVLGTAVTKLLGTTPLNLAVDQALHRFKSLVETGEIPTTERQPAARADTR